MTLETIAPLSDDPILACRSWPPDQSGPAGDHDGTPPSQLHQGLGHDLRANLLIDENACSSRGSTPPSMKEIFTFADRDHENFVYEQPNFLELARAAGYRLYWLSNQQTEGSYDSQVSFLHRAADERVFINKRGWSDGVSSDGELLPRLKTYCPMELKKGFSVVHLIGTHDAYDLRFPAEFGNFKTEAGLNGRILVRRGLADYLFRGSRIELSNAYDNAVLYNDKIVYAMLNMMHDSTKDYSVIYLPDHGEALGETGQLQDLSMDLRQNRSTRYRYFWF
jgi:heptose-I-phosphate ethanolaminephosphotransferase